MTAKPNLSADQRWLLMTIGGWQIVDALIDPAAVTALMQRKSGAFNLRGVQGAPEWMTSYGIDDGRIWSPYEPWTPRGDTPPEPRVTVTAAQINAYARELPAEVRAQLLKNASERHANQRQALAWCSCPHRVDPAKPCPWAAENRHHPTDDEQNARQADAIRIRSFEYVYLAKALQLNRTDEPVGQLGLFEVAS